MDRADPFEHDEGDFVSMDAEPPPAPQPAADLFAPPPPPPPQLSPDAIRELARIACSPAIGAAIERRVAAFLRHGHTIVDDRERALFDLPAKAREYLAAGRDLIGDDPGGPASCADQAARRRRALVKLATCAALVHAAHDALAWASAQDPEPAE